MTFCLIVALMMLLVTQAASAITVTYQTLDVPGSKQSGIASIYGNRMIGGFVDSSNTYHGFLYDGNSFLTLDDPLAAPGLTLPNGVDGNRVVGLYYDASGQHHGFVFDGTSYTTLDYPGSISTIATGVFGKNIVGAYFDGTSEHAFLYDGQNYSSNNFLGFETEANGISGDHIVGDYNDHSSYLPRKAYSSIYGKIDPPGSIYSIASGVDGDNIVGGYYDGQVVTHGFFYDGHTYTTIDDPLGVGLYGPYT
jgi:hypothetical protein